MARLPDYSAQRGLNPGSAPRVSTDRSGLAQAGAVGNAVQGAGEEALRVMGRWQQMEEQKEDFAAKQHYAQMNTMIEQDRVSRLEQSPEDGSGFSHGFMNEALFKRQAEFFGKIPQRLHEEYGLKLQTDTMKWEGVAQQNELDKLHANTATVIGEQSNELLNSISLDANNYKDALASGHSLIDVSPLPPSKKAEAKRQWEDAAVAALAQKLIADDPEAAQKALGGGSEAQGPVSQQAASLLREFEGFRTGTYWDVNAHRTGFGSDTITKADGSVHKVRKGDKITRADAERDLARRLPEFENTAIKQVGGKHWGSLPAQARAALVSVAYNYGDLPDKVANAAKTGDVEAIATAVEGLKGHNKGVNSDRRQKEANIIRGSDAIRGGGEIAEVFQGMDYADRLKALNYAEKGLADQQSAIISDIAALKGSFQLQIATDNPNLTAQDILESPLKDSDKATLINSYNTARKEQREASAFAVRLQNGDDFDPYSTDDKNGVDNLYSRVADGISVLDDQNAQALTRDIYQRTGIVPKSALNQIRRGLGSTDPQQTAAAAALAASLQSDRPNEPGLIGARNGGSEIEKAATTYRHMTENLHYSPEDAGQHLADMNDPQKRREREALLETETAKKAIKDISVDTVTAALDPEFFGFDPVFRDPAMEAFALSEFRELFKENIVQFGGKIEDAESLTKEQIARRYGVSDFTAAGNEKIVRYPVEKAFSTVNGNHDWIREQVLETLRADGFTTEYDPLTGEAPDKHVDPGKIYLEPTIETELDIKAGKPPRYLLRYENNGKVEDYGGFFVPNHFIAWYLDRNDDLETARENNAENRARKIESNDTLGSIMGGVEDQMRQRDARARERK